MNAMLAGFVATIVIAVVAWWVLNHLGFSASEVYSGAAVRLD